MPDTPLPNLARFGPFALDLTAEELPGWEKSTSSRNSNSTLCRCSFYVKAKWFRATKFKKLLAERHGGGFDAASMPPS